MNGYMEWDPAEAEGDLNLNRQIWKGWTARIQSAGRKRGHGRRCDCAIAVGSDGMDGGDLIGGGKQVGSDEIWAIGSEWTDGSDWIEESQSQYAEGGCDRKFRL